MAWTRRTKRRAGEAPEPARVRPESGKWATGKAATQNSEGRTGRLGFACRFGCWLGPQVCEAALSLPPLPSGRGHAVHRAAHCPRGRCLTSAMAARASQSPGFSRSQQARRGLMLSRVFTARDGESADQACLSTGTHEVTPSAHRHVLSPQPHAPQTPGKHLQTKGMLCHEFSLLLKGVRTVCVEHECPQRAPVPISGSRPHPWSLVTEEQERPGGFGGRAVSGAGVGWLPDAPARRERLRL